jgi:curli biogenesis system outer membrane secretion channel CsgG
MNILATTALLAASLGLAGCGSMQPQPTRQFADDEVPVITGPAVRANFTPLEAPFACLGGLIRKTGQPVLGIAIGDVKDYTGKYNQNEGSTLTQGGALMLYSALGKLDGAVQIQERFDTRIAELELAYTDRRQLGDGRVHQVEGNKPAVPWVPYFGGSILRSGYYIVGGITELNYDIQTGGAEIAISGVSAKRRTFTMNIGIDLRIIDTRTLVVVKTVSLQKQISGHEVGGGVFRFFGTSLFDLNVGAKSQEPLQLGVRTTLEQGVFELVSAVAAIDGRDCMKLAGQARLAGVAQDSAVRSQPAAVAAAAAHPINAADAAGATGPGLVGRELLNIQVEFDSGSATLAGQAMPVVERIVNEVARGSRIAIQLVSRDTESMPPAQRRDSTAARIRAISEAVAARGIEPARIGISWLPDPADASITRSGAGYQLLATLLIPK